MKKQSLNIRRIFIGLVLSGMMVAISPATFAGTKKQPVTPAVAIQPAIEYVGTESSSATLLHVSFENEAAVKFELTVTDAAGEILFTKEYEAAKFSKYIKLINEGEEDATTLTVAIRTLPNGVAHNFNVTSSDKTVTEVSVNKL